MGQNFSWIEEVGHSLIDKKYDDNEQETSEMQFENFALKSNARALASRTKAKAKPRRPSTSSRTLRILERKWIDIEPGAQFDQAYPVQEE